MYDVSGLSHISELSAIQCMQDLLVDAVTTVWVYAEVTHIFVIG